jgi:hypothetical protein
MKEALYIMLGWLFGLLSQRIVTRIERHYKRNDLKKAIFSDLKNQAVQLTAVYSKIQMHLGLSDKESLSWVKNIHKKYRDDCPRRVLETMEKLLQAPDEQFKIATNLLKIEDNISLSLKTYSLPFIESISEHLSIFEPEFQRKILEIQSQINILNEETEIATFYYRLTFDPLCMKTNTYIIRSNLKENYNEIQHRCRIIVDKICEILEN